MHAGLAMLYGELGTWVKLVHRSRRFFAPGAAEEIWEEFSPALADIFTPHCLEVRSRADAVILRAESWARVHRSAVLMASLQCMAHCESPPSQIARCKRELSVSSPQNRVKWGEPSRVPDIAKTELQFIIAQEPGRKADLQTCAGSGLVRVVAPDVPGSKGPPGGGLGCVAGHNHGCMAGCVALRILQYACA